MKLKSYKDYLGMAKEIADKAMIPFKVRKAEKALELRIIEVEADIASKEVAIQTLVTEKTEINYDDLINAIDRKELQDRKLKQLNELKEQLFK